MDSVRFLFCAMYYTSYTRLLGLLPKQFKFLQCGSNKGSYILNIYNITRILLTLFSRAFSQPCAVTSSVIPGLQWLSTLFCIIFSTVTYLIVSYFPI